MAYFLVSGTIITSANAWEIPFGYYIIDIFMLFILFTLCIRSKRKEEIANNRYRFFNYVCLAHIRFCFCSSVIVLSEVKNIFHRSLCCCLLSVFFPL